MARGSVPEWALTHCASCKRSRGNITRQGWQRIIGNDGQLEGWTCPECPTWDEPIRRVEVRDAVRFKATADATARGALPRRQKSRVCETLDDARSFVAEVRAAAEAVAPVGVEADRSTTTLNELADRWLEGKVKSRANTREGYAQWLGYSRRRFGNRPVAGLIVEDVTGLVGWMEREGGRRGQPLSRTTIADAVKVLAMVLNFGVESGLLVRNIAQSKSIELPRESRVQAEAKRTTLDYWPTAGQGDAATIPFLGRFAAASDLDPLAGAWRLSLCGFTRSEVLGFMWSDLDLDAGEVTVRRGRTPLDSGGHSVDDPKSDQRYRTLPVEALSPGSVKLLRALSAKQAADKLRAGATWTDSGYVVVDELGVPVVPRTYSDRFVRLCAAAGVPRIKLHNLRHSIAQLLLAQGYPVDVAAAVLGHTLAVFMGKYVRQSPAERIKEHARPIIRAA